MAVRVVVVHEAERDITGAYAWYEDRRTGLGEEFLGCLDACIEAIRRMPLTHPTVFRGFRRALLRRFPYAVFYEYESNVATIFGVLHTSRHPGRWMRRATGTSD